MDLITNLTQIPVLGTMPYLQDARSMADLVNAAAALDLEVVQRAVALV
jgi:cobyric acid synthase